MNTVTENYPAHVQSIVDGLTRIGDRVESVTPIDVDSGERTVYRIVYWIDGKHRRETVIDYLEAS